MSDSLPLTITLTWKNGLLLAAMAFIMQETHEISHTATGRLLCGCWGTRDFNLWWLCEGCDLAAPLSVLPTLAGPIYTFGVIWIAGLLLLPFLLVGVIVFGLLQNILLENGVLSDAWILGSSVLATTWLLFSCAVAVILRNQLTTFLTPAVERFG